MGRGGLEHPVESPSEIGSVHARGAESGALTGQHPRTTPTTDSRLVALIDRWESLPEPIRRAISALVDADRPFRG